MLAIGRHRDDRPRRRCPSSWRAACLIVKAEPSTLTPSGTIQCSALRCRIDPGKARAGVGDGDVQAPVDSWPPRPRQTPAASTVTSAWMTRIEPASSASISAAAAFQDGEVRPADRHARAPAAASAAAQPFPIPVPPPVTSADRPVSVGAGRGSWVRSPGLPFVYSGGYLSDRQVAQGNQARSGFEHTAGNGIDRFRGSGDDPGDVVVHPRAAIYPIDGTNPRTADMHVHHDTRRAHHRDPVDARSVLREPAASREQRRRSGD